MAVAEKNMTPLVSVLMPVYNCSAHLAEAVGSVLSQTLADFELVIIDDGSTDGSRVVIDSFDDDRIVVIVNEENTGLAKSLNKGIAACRGRYIARMDGDDTCAPDRLEKQAAFLEKHPDTGLCGTWAETIDDAGRKTGRAKNLTSNDELQINLLFSVPFFHPSVMLRAGLLKGEPYDPDFRQAQDFELWTRLADKTKLANLSAYLIKYRWHESNISVRENSGQEERKREILRRQILKLGIEAAPEDLRLHQAAFGKTISRDVPPGQLSAWYLRLIAANRKTGRYNRPMFRAYLWSRWAVFCKVNGCHCRAIFPQFASANPAVLFYLIRFLLHFAGKSR